MSKGSYPIARNGKVHGHDIYVDGKGWVYHPLPKPAPWIVLDDNAR